MKRYFYWTVLLFILWLILSNHTQIQDILVGIIVSMSVAFMYVNMFKQKNVELIKPVWLFVYLYVLLKNLVISNLQLSKIILSKKIEISPAIIKVETSLKSDWKKLMLANSITLTPGTLTLDIKENSLFIHTILYDEGMDKREIIKEFEEIIEKI